MKSMFKTMQIIWLLAAIGSLVASIINLKNNNVTDAGIFAVLTFVAIFMYYVNKKRTKSFSSNSSNQ
ncbi:MAG: hypothetical protein IT238_08340 [Bacteroidia bacterium]|nr:hypothetical protein [Bacteroidia bacterium]MCZ2248599.1 hypothetical protein [Bacteroidia bacterium]